MGDVDVTPALEPAPPVDLACAGFYRKRVWISSAALGHLLELLGFCTCPWVCSRRRTATCVAERVGELSKVRLLFAESPPPLLEKLPRGPAELQLARVVLLFPAVHPAPGLLPIGPGQAPLKMTFVDDLMHQGVWRDFHSWQRVWGCYDREASK